MRYNRGCGKAKFTMSNYCPVCGYDFKQPVEDNMICVCCGTQYGYHDSVRSHAALRHRWLDGGARWHSKRILPPQGWSVEEQLGRIGVGETAQRQKEAA